jgi:hypothetical protein
MPFPADGGLLKLIFRLSFIYPQVRARVYGLVGPIVVVLGQTDEVLQHFPKQRRQ